MYEFTSLDRQSVPAGSSLLLAGPDAGHTRERLLDGLAEAGVDEAVLLVATDRTDASLAGLRRRGLADEALGVIDVSGAGRTPDGVAEAAAVDPGNLPRLGIAASDRLDRLGHRYDRVRVGLDSVTGLLDASELPAVFRFLHLLTGRIHNADAALVAALDERVHEEETRRTLAAVFDDTVDLD